MFGNDLSCIKNFGILSRDKAISACPILPSSIMYYQFISNKYLSLLINYYSENGIKLIRANTTVEWRQSVDDLLHFSILDQNKHSNHENQSHAEILIDGVDGAAFWAWHGIKDEVNVVCKKHAGPGKTQPRVTSNETKKLDKKLYSSGSSATTLSTKTLATGLIISEDWALSIDLKLPHQQSTKWSNIFSLQVDGSTDFSTGSRLPAVWVRPNQSEVMVMVAYNLGTNPNHTYNITTKFNTGNWINLKISQMNKVYEINIDYIQVYNTTNNMLKKWENVNIVMGNTYATKYISAFGYYRNFDIITNRCKLNEAGLVLHVMRKMFSCSCYSCVRKISKLIINFLKDSLRQKNLSCDSSSLIEIIP